MIMNESHEVILTTTIMEDIRGGMVYPAIPHAFYL
jgi:hypothetical protein